MVERVENYSGRKMGEECTDSLLEPQPWLLELGGGSIGEPISEATSVCVQGRHVDEETTYKRSSCNDACSTRQEIPSYKILHHVAQSSRVDGLVRSAPDT